MAIQNRKDCGRIGKAHLSGSTISHKEKERYEAGATVIMLCTIACSMTATIARVTQMATTMQVGTNLLQLAPGFFGNGHSKMKGNVRTSFKQLQRRQRSVAYRGLLSDFLPFFIWFSK
ncbi:hypothetical protein Tcan_00609, partial [Toxocara canis]